MTLLSTAIASTIATVVDFSDKIKFPMMNVETYPLRDGVRFSINLRKELEAHNIENVRSTFISKFVSLGKTKAHAGNYWDKTNKNRNGVDMHITNKTWASKQPKKVKSTVTEQPIEILILAEETIVGPTVTVSTQVVHERWRVVNKSNEEIVASFSSRTLAQEHNKQLKELGEDVKWVDGLKSVN